MAGVWGTVTQGRASAQGFIVAIHADGRVCVDVGGRVECGTLVPPYRAPEPTAAPVMVATAQGAALPARSR